MGGGCLTQAWAPCHPAAGGLWARRPPRAAHSASGRPLKTLPAGVLPGEQSGLAQSCLPLRLWAGRLTKESVHGGGAWHTRLKRPEAESPRARCLFAREHTASDSELIFSEWGVGRGEGKEEG